MAGQIKMALGTKIGLDPCHIVLHGDPAAPRKGTAAHSSFQSMFIVDTVAHLS